MTASLNIDVSRLEATVITLLKSVGGPCSQAGVAVGEINGKEIYLSVTNDEEEMHEIREQHHAITLSRGRI